MSGARITEGGGQTGSGGRWPGFPAGLAAILAIASALAGGGAAQAAPRPGAHQVSRSGIISALAGGAGGPAPATSVSLAAAPPGDACGVAFGGGRLYIANQAAVRAVDPQTDGLTTPAGTAAPAPPGDGGPATKAGFSTCGVATDAAGNLVIADWLDNRVRVVAVSTGTFYGQAMTAGHIYTVAGTGTNGYSGDGGPAASAELSAPRAVTVDSAGNLVIADSSNNRVRVVAVSTGTFYGQAMAAGNIYTVAGGGTHGLGNGGPATSARLGHPWGVATDSAGNLVIADTGDQSIRVVADSTGTFYGKAMTAGNIYPVAGNGTAGYSGDGGPAGIAELDGPEGVAVDGSGNLIIADTLNHRIRIMADSTGTFYGQAMTARDIYTVAGNGTLGYAGDGGAATSAELNAPEAAIVDGAGNLVIADTFNDRVRVVAATTASSYGQAMTAGDIYTVAGNGTARYAGDGGRATAAELIPDQVAVDANGNVAIADAGGQRIRVVAAATGTFYGQAMTAGHVYTVAGNGTNGYSGDGGPATSAALSNPRAVAVDSAGNLLIADISNERVRVVAATAGTFYGQAMTGGDIYTVAGNGTPGFTGDRGPATSADLNNPQGVSLDGGGNIVIADTTNERVRVVAGSTGTFYGQAMTAGDIYTVAGGGTDVANGGLALRTLLNHPEDVSVDGAGNLVIAMTAKNLVRVVADSTGTFYGQTMTALHIYTVAGNGASGFAGDGGPALSAAMLAPAAVAVDNSGNLIIADTGNERIRVVAEQAGTFYGQVMAAGDIYTVAGDGVAGFAGDNGLATRAALDGPQGVTVDHAGNLVIADTSSFRVRRVTP